MNLHAINERAHELLRSTKRRANRVIKALRLPPPPKPLADVLVRPVQMKRGPYVCTAHRPAAQTSAQAALLRQEISQLRNETNAAFARTTNAKQQRRLHNLRYVYDEILNADLSDACVTVRAPGGGLAAVAYLSDPGFARALDLEYLASNPACLLGTRLPGITPGEAALATCVRLSIQCGLGGALEAQALDSARGWYEAHHFSGIGWSLMRLSARDARQNLRVAAEVA